MEDWVDEKKGQGQEYDCASYLVARAYDGDGYLPVPVRVDVVADHTSRVCFHLAILHIRNAPNATRRSQIAVVHERPGGIHYENEFPLSRGSRGRYGGKQSVSKNEWLNIVVVTYKYMLRSQAGIEMDSRRAARSITVDNGSVAFNAKMKSLYCSRRCSQISYAAAQSPQSNTQVSSAGSSPLT